MHEEISDTRLQRHLQNYLRANPKHFAYMKSIAYCGSKTIRQRGALPAVFVLANNEDATFFGHVTCKNAWCCPVCSAKRMAEYASQISCAIDALKAKENQVAFMLTLTIPHTRGMSCVETTEILYDTWKNFTKKGNKVGTNSRWAIKDPFAMFCEEFHSKHRVRVGEYTHGDAGWHPHFHCLIWVDKAKLQQTLEWQDLLRARWTELAKKNTLKQWNKMHPDKKDDNRARLEIMYRKLNPNSKTLYISVDERGKVIEQKSSMYICGWGADKEATGNFRNKATYEGHETPYQILERAVKDKDEAAMELYLEYAYATRIKKHARINFSIHSGIKKIIEEWRNSHAYEAAYKKKFTEIQKKAGRWRVVCWFSENQWSSICYLNREHALKEKILKLALKPDGRRRIDLLLREFGLDLIDKPHHLTDLIEEIFNKSPFQSDNAA